LSKYQIPIAFSFLCFGQEEFDASSEANKRTKRSSKSVMEDHKGSEVEHEDASSTIPMQRSLRLSAKM